MYFPEERSDGWMEHGLTLPATIVCTATWEVVNERLYGSWQPINNMKSSNSSDGPYFFRQLLCALALAGLLCGCGKGADKQEAKPPGQPGSPRSPANTQPPADSNSAAIGAIRRAGYPVTLAELNAWYVEPPSGQNAAPLYAEAFAALVETNTASLGFVARNQKTLELLHQAGARPLSRYPVDFTQGWMAALPHLEKVKLCSQLLHAEAVANAARGRMDLAAQSVLAGLRLARSLEQEPIILSQLVRVVATEHTVTGIELALRRGTFPEALAGQLQAALRLAEENSGAAIVRSLAGEQCMGTTLFESSEQIGDILEAMRQMVGESGPPNPDTLKVLERHASSPAFKQDEAFYLDRMEALLAAAQSPFPASLETAKAWSDSVLLARLDGHIYSAMFLPANVRLLEKSATAVAELRTAQAALALERYHLTHNNALPLSHNDSLPESLDQLVPQYLTAVPLDPFDGQPLRYKKNYLRGYVIYSIGPDRQDNGGLHKMTPVPVGARYDLAFTVAR